MKQTIVDQIEITRDGHIQIRLLKQFIDGDEVYDLGYHRTIVEVGGDVASQMALVNAHLGRMGMGVVEAKEINSIQQYSLLAFTPEKIAIHTAKLEAELIKNSTEVTYGNAEAEGGEK